MLRVMLALIWVFFALRASADEYLCLTPQFSDRESMNTVQLNKFSQDSQKVVIDHGSSQRSQTLTMRDFQVAFGSDAWQISDSLPGGDGTKIRIGVAFLDGNPFQRNAVKQFASEWLSKDGASNVEFVFDDSQTSHIRITFEADLNDNRSLIGRQALTAKNKAPTMWLGDVRDDVSPVRVAQVIRHEFGHALGMRHEHQHPKGGIRWNEPVVLGELASYGWSADMVRRNIFNVYSVSYVCVGAADFDPHSIMMYPIKKAWTLDGYQVGDNNDIVPADLKCVHSLYSK